MFRLPTIFILIFLISALGVNAQVCIISTSETTFNITCGDSIQLSVIGYDSLNAHHDDFNAMQLASFWDSTYNEDTVFHTEPGYGNFCGMSLDGSPVCWISPFGPSAQAGGNFKKNKSLATDSNILVPCGGSIIYEFKMGSALENQLLGPDCSGVVLGLGIGSTWVHYPSSGVNSVYYFGVFLRGRNGVSNWDSIHAFENISSFNGTYYFLNTQYYSWDTYVSSIPQSLWGNNLRLQWMQSYFNSNGNFGLDNVHILPAMCGYYYNWNHLPTANDPSEVWVSPSDTTVYRVYYTNGVNDSSYVDITVNVIPQISTISSLPDSIGCNDCAELQVDIPSENLGFEDMFDSLAPLSTWDTIVGGFFDNSCGNNGGNVLRFSGSPERIAVTRPVNTLGCDSISFCMYMGNSQTPNNQCGDVVPGESVNLQYSLNGQTWNTFFFIDENLWEINPNWQCFTVAIPQIAQQQNVQFRFIQPNFTFGANASNWALDDVKTSCSNDYFSFDWQPANFYTDNTIENAEACLQNSDQELTVTMTHQLNGCVLQDTFNLAINHCGCEIYQHQATIDSCYLDGYFGIHGDIAFYDNPSGENLIIAVQTDQTTLYDTLYASLTEGSIYNYFLDSILSTTNLQVVAYFENSTTCKDTLTLQIPQQVFNYNYVQSNTLYCGNDPVQDLEILVNGTDTAEVWYLYITNYWKQEEAINGIVNLGNGLGVYYIDSLLTGNCSFYLGDTITVAQYPNPTVVAMPDQNLCIGDSVQLTASGANSYQWNNGGIDSVFFQPQIGQYTYILTGTDTNSCTNTDTVNITVNNLPQVSFTADTLEGCEPLEVTFTNTTPSTQSLTWNINGSNYNTNTVVHEFNAGLYTITLEVTDQNNCVNDTSYTNYIEVHPNPLADFNTSNNQINSLDNSVSFTNESTGATYYEWSFGDGDSSTLVDPIHSYLGNERIIFQVELLATSTEGCTDRAYQSIELKPELLYYVPNTFTPNADASNNTFQPVFTSGIDFTSYNLEIYNRGGKLIFETTDHNQAWDGTFNGKPVPDGVYTYKIYFTSAANAEREFITGHVNVLR